MSFLFSENFKFFGKFSGARLFVLTENTGMNVLLSANAKMAGLVSHLQESVTVRQDGPLVYFYKFFIKPCELNI